MDEEKIGRSREDRDLVIYKLTRLLNLRDHAHGFGRHHPVYISPTSNDIVIS